MLKFSYSQNILKCRECDGGGGWGRTGKGVVGLWVVCQLGANWDKREKQVAQFVSYPQSCLPNPPPHTHSSTHLVALYPSEPLSKLWTYSRKVRNSGGMSQGYARRPQCRCAWIQAAREEAASSSGPSTAAEPLRSPQESRGTVDWFPARPWHRPFAPPRLTAPAAHTTHLFNQSQ